MADTLVTVSWCVWVLFWLSAELASFTVGPHPKYSSKCFFIVKKDGTKVRGARCCTYAHTSIYTYIHAHPPSSPHRCCGTSVVIASRDVVVKVDFGVSLCARVPVKVSLTCWSACVVFCRWLLDDQEDFSWRKCVEKLGGGKAVDDAEAAKPE